MKKQNGITLIALIITIIVMLILVGVSVTVALNGGLFTTAEESRARTLNAVGAEQELDNGRIKVAGVWYDSYDNYIAGIPSANQGEGSSGGETENGGWTDNGNGTFTKGTGAEAVTVGLGQVVNYNEGTGHTYTPDTSKGAGTEYVDTDEDGEPDTLTTSEITNGDLGWKVLGVNNNGYLELISDSLTSETLKLIGAQGYINAEDVLNGMCDALYGKGTGAKEARSLNIEDVNKLEGYTPEVSYIKYAFYDGTIVYKQAENENDFSNINTWDKLQTVTGFDLSTMTATFADVTVLNGLGDDGTDWIIDSDHSTVNKVLKIDYYDYNLSSNKAKQIVGMGEYDAETETWTYHDGDGACWLASRSIKQSGQNVFYYVRSVLNFGHTMGIQMILGGVNRSQTYPPASPDSRSSQKLRPVVTLSSNVQLVETANGSGIWNIQ